MFHSKNEIEAVLFYSGFVFLRNLNKIEKPVQQQKQGKTYEETKPTKSIYETLNGRDLVSAKEDNLIKKKRRWRALENFYNALNYHVRIYNRPNNTTWLYDAFDTIA